MPRSRLRILLAATALALSPVLTPPLLAHDGPAGHAHGDGVARAAKEMAQAARNLWAALTPEQQTKAGFAFKDAQRYDWHFIPRARRGLPLKEMTHGQRALAHALLASGLSARGFVEAETIMSLEEILREMENGRGPARDPELYYYTIFGDPSAKDASEPWGWRVEGHHVSLNFTIAGNKGAAAGPTFLGSNPAEVRQGPRKGLRVLGEEEELGRQLARMLDDEQKKTAILAGDVPKDVLSFVARKAEPLKPAGLMASEMTAAQKELLTRLVVNYAERLRPELAHQELAEILKAGADKVGFAWAGSTEPGQPHYYRVQGPTFLLEYDNTQNNANHVHSVWRDFDGDFGEDLLKKHYEAAGADHGHDAKKDEPR